MFLYRSHECIGYAELEQPWKYMPTCLYAVEAFIHAEALRNKFDHVIKMAKVNPKCHSFEQIW